MRQRYAIEDAEHPIYQRKPATVPYSCESEELESLREQVISLNRDRAELIEALRLIVNDAHTGHYSVSQDARALLRELGEAE